MNDMLQLPRSWLSPKIVRESDFLRAVAYLVLKINANGSADFSSGDAQMLFGMSPRRYRTFMNLITSDKLSDKQATNRTTNISFKTQVVTSTKRQAKRQTSDKLSDKQNPAKFIPPTEQQVADYIAEKGYHFDPLAFIPFYESKGWKIGNQPMKDWKASCRTWEIRWKEKYGERFYYQIKQLATTNTPAVAAKESRDRMRGLASAILSQSDSLINLYNGRGQNPEIERGKE